jgi:hypothetical protein
MLEREAECVHQAQNKVTSEGPTLVATSLLLLATVNVVVDDLEIILNP